MECPPALKTVSVCLQHTNLKRDGYHQNLHLDFMEKDVRDNDIWNVWYSSLHKLQYIFHALATSCTYYLESLPAVYNPFTKKYLRLNLVETTYRSWRNITSFKFGLCSLILETRLLWTMITANNCLHRGFSVFKQKMHVPFIEGKNR